MKKLLCSCLAFGALAGAALTHPTLAMAFEPVWLTEEEMDRVTAGFEFEWSGIIVGSWTHTFETALPGGGTAVTSATIVCNGCTASISINQASGSSNIVATSVTSVP
jgi:apolipoprotein N-acyltransferase